MSHILHIITKRNDRLSKQYARQGGRNNADLTIMQEVFYHFTWWDRKKSLLLRFSIHSFQYYHMVRTVFNK